MFSIGYLMKTEIRCQTTDGPRRRKSTCSTKQAAHQTSSHTLTVTECAWEIAVRHNERHRNHADIELVIAGALLHDIGRACSKGTDHAVAGAEIAQAFGPDMRIIKRHIRDGIP